MKRKGYNLEMRFYDLSNLEILIKQQMSMEGKPTLLSWENRKKSHRLILDLEELKKHF